MLICSLVVVFSEGIVLSESQLVFLYLLPELILYFTTNSKVLLTVDLVSREMCATRLNLYELFLVVSKWPNCFFV